MTLNITLFSPWGVYQASDFRIVTSFKGKKTEFDENGAKQFTISNLTWNAQLCFAGIARKGKYDTRDWIRAALMSLDINDTVDDLVQTLGQAGTLALKECPKVDRILTISIAVLVDSRFRVYLLSNVDKPDGSRWGRKLNHLRVYRKDPGRPGIWVTGAPEYVSRDDRKLLLRMLKKRHKPEDIQDKLAEIFQKASRNKELGVSYVSPECYVYSLLPDHSGQGKNYGEVAGTPENIISGFNMGEWVRNNVRPAKGKKLTLKQVGSAKTPGNLEEYNKAIEFNAANPSLFNGRGLIYKEMGKFSLAMNDFEEALRLNPKSHATYNNRGITHLATGNLEEAIADLNMAIELSTSKKDLMDKPTPIN